MTTETSSHGFDIPTNTLDRWRLLWSKADRPTPNAQPDRFLATTRALGSEPVILELKDSAGRQGMIIARREPVRVTRRIGYLPVRTPMLDTLVVVYGGILGDVAAETVTDALLECLNGTGRCDHIMLNMLPTDSPIMDCLRKRGGVAIQPPTPHWVTRLQTSFDAIMEGFSRKHRYNLRSELRKLERVFDDGCEWVTLTRGDEIDRILEHAFLIGSQTYHANLGGGLVKRDELWKTLLHLAASANSLRAHFLVGNGTPIAFWLGWNENDTLYLVATGYLPEYEKYSPGKHLLLKCIARACEDGMSWVDFGFGDAEYKRIYGTESWQESAVHIYGDSVRTELAWGLDRGATGLDMVLKRVAGSSFASRIKKVWRAYLRGD